MKLSSNFTSKTFGTARRVSNPIFFIIIGLVLVAICALMLLGNSSTKNFVKVDARIVDITLDDEVYVEYSVDGITYTSMTNSYSSSYRVGDKISVKYNPQNPLEISSGFGALPYIFGVLGLISIAGSISSFIKNTKKNKAFKNAAKGLSDDGKDGYEDDRYEEASSKYLPKLKLKDILPGFTPNLEDGEINEYYFYFHGKANQGHLMETPQREAVYEAELKKFSLVGESEYEFIDYVNNKKSTHYIGKTTTTNQNSFSANSSFSIDGENALDIVRAEGYTVDNDLSITVIKATYTINYKGQKIGEIKTAGSAIMPNVKSNAVSENLITRGLYKIYTSKSNIPVMFYYAMIFSRTEMVAYE